MHWLALSARLYAIIGDTLPEGTAPLPSLDLELTPQDRAQFEIYKRDGWLANYDRRADRGEIPRDPKIRLSQIEGILAAASDLPASDSRDRCTVFYSTARGDLLLELGDFKGAAAAYRVAISLEHDSEARQMLEEEVAEMESRWRMA
jgi:hypothetical protein